MKVNRRIAVLFLVLLVCLSFLSVFRIEAQAPAVLSNVTISKFGTEFNMEKVALAKIMSTVYELAKDAMHPEGGVEYEVYLMGKPESGLSKNWILNLSFVSKGLEFYYQPPLTEEFKEADCEVWTETHVKTKDGREYWRPENIVGSYAVYATGKSGNQYKTGKVFHIYRPLLIDADGKESWAKLNITGNTLQIIADSAWLSTAKYPVTIDPTFGYTSLGANTISGSLTIWGSQATLAANSTVTDMTVAAWGTGNVRTGIYTDNASSPDVLKVESASVAIVSAVKGWQNIDVADTAFTSGTYWLAVQESEEYAGYLAYDSSADNGFTKAQAYGAFPNPISGVSLANSWIFSIYANYTAAGPENLTVTLNAPTNESTVTAYVQNFNYTATLYGSDTFHNASLYVNGSSVANNVSAIQNNTLNTITYTFSSNGLYLWDVQVWNSTNAVWSSNGNFTLTVNYTAITGEDALGIAVIALTFAIALPIAFISIRRRRD